MPVNPPANRTDIHLFTLLDLAPTQLAMRYELFVSLDPLLNRKVLEGYDPLLLGLDMEYFLAAVGAVGVKAPPVLDAF